jgi:PIN domain nuclease of toxin-antitoxin system
MGGVSVILLDTHIWYWWVDDPTQLSASQITHLQINEPTGLGVSVFSCWELAKKVEKGKLNLSLPIDQWIQKALNYPGIQLLPLSPEIAIESTCLPKPFHGDPADQIIVATARILNLPLLTADSKILNYSHVVTLN